MSLSDQIPVHGIFARTFSRERPVYLMPARLTNHPKLADLEVSQFVVDEGWIGVAFGAKQMARRPLLRRR
jgi:hypothetical protein